MISKDFIKSSSKEYISANPFPHCEIKNLWDENFLNELGNVDPDHPLVAQEIQNYILDDDEMVEKAERGPKGHKGFI